MAAAEKSTTVRSSSELPTARAAKAADLDALADAFFRPRKARALPRPEQANAREWRTRTGRLTGWSWGSGAPMLLVHGWEGQANQMARIAESVVARGFRAIALDLPAHGGSDGTWASAVTFADAIHHVVEQEGRLSGLLAHSLGGAASGLALSEGLEVDRVCLLSPVAEPTPFAAKLGRWAGLEDEQLPELFAAIERRGGISFANLYLPTRLLSLSAKLLVMHDPEDSEVPIEHGQAIARAAPHGRLVPMTGVGHHRILEDALVVAAATDFLSGHEA
jgi:pimeloyl-ACP methyl ester carboxylesterase